VPQVSGVVVWKAAEFEPGGSFAKGDLLFEVDPRDYQLSAAQADAQVAQARYQLELAQEEAAIARQEWERIRTEGEEPTNLVLRKPQLRAAEANLQSAEARYAETQLRLERTKVYAPFNGRVRSAAVDVGQHLNAGQSIAQIYSIEKAEIVVPVPDEDLGWFTLPFPIKITAQNAPGDHSVYNPNVEGGAQSYSFAREGASAIINGSFAGRSHQWNGRVIRTEGELDPQSRMARLVVEVDAPYGGIAEGIPPLTIGMFVDVAIAGRHVDGVRILPRAAVRQGDRVWVVGPDGKLRVRQAQVVRTIEDEVLTYLDLEKNERVIVSQLSGVTDGMQVRLTVNNEEAGS
jgi:RND family efflux transporter MFP subunit